MKATESTSKAQLIQRKLWKVAAATGVIINLMEDLEEAGYFKRELKNKAKNFKQSLGRFEAEVSDKTTIKGNETEFWQQQDDMYTYFESWLDAAYLVQQDNFESFDRDVEAAIEKYKKQGHEKD